MAGIEAASLFGVINLVDNLTPGLRTAQGSIDNFAGNLSRLGGSLTSIGAQMGLLTAPVIAFGVAGVNVAADFDSAMREISARTGLVGADLENIRSVALQMGADTSFSAQQAADAFLELLASGQTAAEAIETLPAVLDAAAASGMDLGQAADDVTNIMAGFRLPVNQARRVVDVLSRAAGASSADMADLADAFANVGGVAASFGLDVETTAAIFGIFAENGVKGAEAGTQLKSMLLNMARDTDEVAGAWEAFGTSLYDAQGNLRPLPEVLNEIEAAAANMTDAERQQAFQALAGSYGILGLTALTAGGDISTMQTRMGEAADATDVAAARLGGFEGAMEALRGSVETFQIQALTPLMNEGLTPLVQELTTTVNGLSEWAAANPEATQSVGKLAIAGAGLSAGMVILGTVINGVGTVIGALTAAGSALVSLALTPIAGAIAVVAGVITAYMSNFLGFRDWVDELGNKLRAGIAMLELLALTVATVGNAISAELTTSLNEANDQLVDFLNNLAAALGLSSTTTNITPVNPLDPFGGARAAGGPVRSGSSYLVGENGPEMFTPGRSGMITPNGAGGTSVHVQQLIVGDMNTRTDEEIKRLFKQSMMELLPAGGQR